MVLVDVQWVLAYVEKTWSSVQRRKLDHCPITHFVVAFLKCFWNATRLLFLEMFGTTSLLFLSLLVNDVAHSGRTLALRLCAYLTLRGWQRRWSGRRWQMWWSCKSCFVFTFLHLSLHLHRWLSLSWGLSFNRLRKQRGCDGMANPRGPIKEEINSSK